MRTLNQVLMLVAFLAGIVSTYFWAGIHEYDMHIAVKTPNLPSEEPLCLNDGRYEFEPEAFLENEKALFLKAMKNACRHCRIVGMPEPVCESPEAAYFVRATIPFYQNAFYFHKDGTLIDAELSEEDEKTVREIILTLAFRMQERGVRLKQ